MSIERVELKVELDDGTEHEIRIGNPSQVAWDRMRAQNDWPAATEAPMLWMTYLAWHHLKHALKVIDCTYPEFEAEKCVALEAVGEDETEGPFETTDDGKRVPITDPTPLVAVPGSPSS